MKTESSIIKLSVLEERVCNMQKQNNIDHTTILKRIDEMSLKLDATFITKAEFGPVQKIAYSMVGIVCTSVLLAIIALVIRN